MDEGYWWNLCHNLLQEIAETEWSLSFVRMEGWIKCFKCQADWCLSNQNWWPSIGLFMLLRWLLAAQGLVLAFRMIIQDMHDNEVSLAKMRSYWEENKVLSFRRGYFFCYSVQDQFVGSFLCSVQSVLVFFSENILKAKKRLCLLWSYHPGIKGS